MDLDSSRLLLESLLDRIERDNANGKWRISGPITMQEREALYRVLQYLGSDLGPEDGDSLEGQPIAAPAVLPEVHLNTHAASLRSAEDPEVTMCLDFGTAMSKAFAFHTADSRPIDVALGRRAGCTEVVYPVPSSIFISGTGRVFLGQEAIVHSLQEPTPGQKRFDSLKQEISQRSITDLSQVPVPEDKNPSGVPFTTEELITLYLAYLTDMAGAELKERHGLSRYVRRRFALPCWEPKRREWATNQLKRMLARAQILADTVDGQWQGGIDAKKLRALFDKLKGVAIPEVLIGEGVPEPVAAASSRVVKGRPQRLPFLVIDVGAGTTDFGVFVIREQSEAQRPRVFPVPGSVRGFRQAGDTIDKFLRAAILKKHGVDRQDSYGQRIGAELDLRIRQFKETLFRDLNLRYNLADDTSGEIKLGDFMKEAEVIRFSAYLKQELQKTLGSIDVSWIKEMAKQGLTVVLTGGGARLQMVTDLAKGVSESRGFSIQRRAAQHAPVWIMDAYQEFRSEYLQLAVAMGGASPDLPEMGPEFNTFGGGITRPTVVAGNLQLTGT